MAEEKSFTGSVAQEDEGRRCPSGAGCPCGLVDVFDIPYSLRAPGGVIGQIMLPSRTHHGAAIMASKASLIRTL